MVCMNDNQNGCMGKSKHNYLTESDLKWEVLFASDEAQQLLETMANEVFDEILAGKVKPMVFTGNGYLIHG
jgi:hypothetical protein